MRRWGCYSDDMILSSGDPFSRPAAVAALRELTHAVQGYGFEPHAHPVDGLVAYAWDGPEVDAPAVGEGLDDEEAAP